MSMSHVGVVSMSIDLPRDTGKANYVEWQVTYEVRNFFFFHEAFSFLGTLVRKPPNHCRFWWTSCAPHPPHSRSDTWYMVIFKFSRPANLFHSLCSSVVDDDGDIE